MFKKIIFKISLITFLLFFLQKSFFAENLIDEVVTFPVINDALPSKSSDQDSSITTDPISKENTNAIIPQNNNEKIPSTNTPQTQNIQGSIVDEIKIEKDGQKNILKITGDFEKSSFEPIIKIEKDPTEFTIAILSALIDPEAISNPIINFSKDSPLKLINITEDEKFDANGKIIFTIYLKGKSRSPIIPELITPVTKKGIKFLLNPANSVSKNKTSKPVAKLSKKASQRSLKLPPAAPINNNQFCGNTNYIPNLLKISILNASGIKGQAFNLSVYLGQLKKSFILKKRKIKLSIINIGNASTFNYKKTVIYYRPCYLKLALALSEIIPGDQSVAKMPYPKKRTGIDIEIYLGANYH